MPTMPKIDPTTTQAWKALQRHFKEIQHLHLADLFANDATRAADFSIAWEEFFVDVSKNRITPETRTLLLQLAEEVKLKEAISAQFQGERINETENRAALHTALRDFSNMKPEVAATLEHMKMFSESIISGAYTGHTGKTITDVVNIGIGGSHLGPEMVYEALSYYNQGVKVHFVSNIDGDAVYTTLDGLDPERTLCIVVSKSFTTQETLANATTVRQWLVSQLEAAATQKHFIGVTANPSEARSFGIADEHIFPMWDWVGGRFSLWSAVGLSICCAIGYHRFEEMLKGAHAMDQHFQTAPFSENIPVALGLISVWYNNFFKCETEAVLPYAQALHKLVPYLQQAVMESNGKRIDRNGAAITYQTGSIVWGATGTNAQHAFFQLLHQGTKLIPTDFICFATSLYDVGAHHDMLVANCLAQTEALMEGSADKTQPFRNFEGNKPSTTILIQSLTPKNLGALVAMYEHKLFVQGVVWNISSYDQWGVELGKKVASNTLRAIQEKDVTLLHNASTQSIFKKL